jgi:hypothetical protein
MNAQLCTCGHDKSMHAPDGCVYDDGFGLCPCTQFAKAEGHSLVQNAAKSTSVAGDSESISPQSLPRAFRATNVNPTLHKKTHMKSLLTTCQCDLGPPSGYSTHRGMCPVLMERIPATPQPNVAKVFSITDGACSNCGLGVDSISHQVYCEITLIQEAAKQSYEASLTKGLTPTHNDSPSTPQHCNCLMTAFGIVHVPGCSADASQTSQEKK